MRFLPFAVTSAAVLIVLAACGGSTEPIPNGSSTSSSGSSTSSGSSSGGNADGSCVSGARRIANGESFNDGCNSCSCNAGSLACTTRACPDPPPSGGCEYNGKSYSDGATFPSIDGCNTCGCEKGSVACTKKACAEDAGAYKCPPDGTINCQPIVPPKNAAFCAPSYRKWIEENCPNVKFVD